jgi:hypothetical protein
MSKTLHTFVTMKDKDIIRFTLEQIGVDSVDSNTEMVYEGLMDKIKAEDIAKRKAKAEANLKLIKEMTYTYTKQNGKTCQMIGVGGGPNGIWVDFDGNFDREGVYGEYARDREDHLLLGCEWFLISTRPREIMSQEQLAERKDADIVYRDLHGRMTETTKDRLKGMVEYHIGQNAK